MAKYFHEKMQENREFNILSLKKGRFQGETGLSRGRETGDQRRAGAGNGAPPGAAHAARRTGNRQDKGTHNYI